MTDKAREEFETAFRSAGQFKAMSSAALDSMLERGSDGEYRSVRVHGAWWGWQASRAAIVIGLPEGFETYCGSTEERVIYADEMKDVLVAAGLKVAQ